MSIYEHLSRQHRRVRTAHFPLRPHMLLLILNPCLHDRWATRHKLPGLEAGPSTPGAYSSEQVDEDENGDEAEDDGKRFLANVLHEYRKTRSLTRKELMEALATCQKHTESMVETTKLLQNDSAPHLAHMPRLAQLQFTDIRAPCVGRERGFEGINCG